MEEKRRDLIVTKQKRIIADVIERVSKEHPDLYYMPTVEVAAAVKQFIHTPANLDIADYALVKSLKRHDIQMLLSLH